MKPYFLTFYTEGLDGGYDLRDCAKQIKERLSPYFEEMFLFNKRTLKEFPYSDEICNEHEEELDQNPNANKIGYFDFKPFLIQQVLNTIPENAILIYHDSNFEKNPQYWEADWENISNNCLSLLQANESDIFVAIERDYIKVKEYVKTYTIDKLIPDPTENNLIRNCRLINAARIILRNTSFSREFVKEYLNLCKYKTLLAKSPNPNPDPAFKWSCGDQDVLNCLVYRYILDGKLNPEFPGLSFLYRVLRFDNRGFNWPGMSWNPHPTGCSKLLNEELIQYLENKCI